jgi:glyoxylase-like metal-dependent hydrolase (beta-lactamase superfamily II)
MKNLCLLLISVLIVLLSAPCKAQPVEKGPYTVMEIGQGVFHIEDSNRSNPAGIHLDKDGKAAGLNNCSDMYLVEGKDKILLIDLSNNITWDSTAVSSLRSIIYSVRGNKQLYITVTHFHGDHTGMLHAFKDDQKATFWIPGEEFRGKDIFPAGRTIPFSENASLDLGGGYVINSFEVPGHSPHSTIFFLKGKNLVFTGDAIGSGNGVWLFSKESFIAYKASIDRLIKYIRDPKNGIDAGKLVIYGGHYWQKGKTEKLGSQYIFDMQTLIEKIGKGSAEEEKVTYNQYLDTNFRYGAATITWNKSDADKYSGKK